MPITAGHPDIGELTLFTVEAIESMGREALKFFGKGSHRPPFDQDLVTQAELHLIASFQNELQKKYADHMLYQRDQLDDGYTHDAKRYLWIFDPLDGVDNFQSGIPIWGMSVALYENYWPLLGAFFMPATKDLFRAAANDKAYWNDRVIHLSQRDEVSQESLLLTFSRFHQHYQTNFPGKIRDFGSTGAHICYVAMGRADAAITANESFKDLAAVSVILNAAGGSILKSDGQPFHVSDLMDGRRDPQHLLISGEANAGLILETLAAKQ